MKLDKNLNVAHISNRYLVNKNFAGIRSEYNADGKRSFNLCLDDPNAKYTYGDIIYDDLDEFGHAPLAQLPDDLVRDGWNVKVMPANEEKNYDAHPYVKINVKLDFDRNRLPLVYMINRNNQKVLIGEGDMSRFFDDIGNSRFINWMNVAVRPWNYDYKKGGNHQSGDAAVMYFKFIENDVWEDEFM